MSKRVYTAGHMLSIGSQMQRNIEARELRELGCSVFNPMEADHNDKVKHADEPLAERILHNDTVGINWSDVVVIEPLPEALGTHVELGQILGMHDVAQEVLDMMNDEDFDIRSLRHAMNKHVNRKVYPHYEDIRRVDGITETEDRRSLGINQDVYGACLKLTEGKGFYSWDEIKEELK